MIIKEFSITAFISILALSLEVNGQFLLTQNGGDVASCPFTYYTSYNQPLTHSCISKVADAAYYMATDPRIATITTYGTNIQLCQTLGNMESLGCFYYAISNCLTNNAALNSATCFSSIHYRFDASKMITQGLAVFPGNALNQVIRTVNLLIAFPRNGPYHTNTLGFWNRIFYIPAEFIGALSLLARHLINNNLYDRRIIEWAYLQFNSLRNLTTTTDKNFAGSISVFQRYLDLNTFVSQYNLDPNKEPFTNATFFTTPIKPSKGNLLRYVRLPRNYEFSFDITPFASSSSAYAHSVFRLTATGRDYGQIGDRLIALFLYGEQSKVFIDVMFGNSVSTDWSTRTAMLPLETKSSLKFKVMDRVVESSLNGVVFRMDVAPGDRFSGDAFMFSSDAWYTAADCEISNLKINPLPDTVAENILALGTKIKSNGASGQWHYIPKSYSLTFKIMPQGKVNVISNIIHVTSTGNDADRLGSRNPAVWFAANSYNLVVQVGSDNDMNFGLTVSKELPENVVTEVKIEIFGIELRVYFDDELVEVKSIETRINAAYSGPADVYIGSPWNVLANADISDLKITPITKSALLYSNKNFNSVLIKNTNLGKYDMPYSFSMTFKIKPFGIIANWASIVHVTKTGIDDLKPGGRIPGIWFKPSSYSLHVRVGSDSDGDFGLTSLKPLIKNAVTDVKVEVNGTILTVYFNGTSVGTASCASRINAAYAGSSTVYIGDPWYSAANAAISELNITPIPTTVDLFVNSNLNAAIEQNLILANQDMVIKANSSIGKYDMPFSFSMTFKIMPLGKLTTTSNLLHITKTGTNTGIGARMPAIWLNANTYTLNVRVGSDSDGNFGLNTLKPLIENAVTHVKVDVIGTILTVYFNGTSVGTASCASRINAAYSGLSDVYVSDPWYSAANAGITDLKITAFPKPVIYNSGSALDVAIIKNTNMGKYDMPLNFSMTFKIKPFGKIGDWVSIVHVTKTGNDMDIGGRIPCIQFRPNSYTLHVRVGSDSDWNFGLDSSQQLPENAVTDVKVEVIGITVKVFFNGTSVGTASCESRINVAYTGLADVYIGDPWYQAANAGISDLAITPIKNAVDVYSSRNFDAIVKKNLYLGKTEIPSAFSMTLKIKPFGKVLESASIIHVTKTGTNIGIGSKMPGMWFLPNTYTLHVEVGSDFKENFGLDVSQELPENVVTDVTVEVNGPILTVYFNGTSVGTISSATRDNPAYSANSQVFFGDRWSTPANAIISSFAIDEMKAPSTISLAKRSASFEISEIALDDELKVGIAENENELSKRTFTSTEYLNSLISNSQSICNVFQMPDSAIGCISVAMMLKSEGNDNAKIVYDTLFKYNAGVSAQKGSISYLHQTCAKWHRSDQCQNAMDAYGETGPGLPEVAMGLNMLYEQYAPQF